MKPIRDFIADAVSGAMYGYIRFVYRSSRVTRSGLEDVLACGMEHTVFAFWHGDSFCLYGAFEGLPLYIITTKDRRGDYISGACHRFGYQTLRLPDSSDGGFYVRTVAKTMARRASALAISLDGPLGPYREPKPFPFAMAYLLKRNVIPVSVRVRRKIVLYKRWDFFAIPLPFNRIELTYHPPLPVTQEDKAENFSALIQTVRQYP